MYIKSIELIGFKSYATRTLIEDFDPKFNAITGLNGSGKSNILDAICFVLGITSLQHVRVTNLQELVYKQGQAGVTKASVTIIFDNMDPLQKPVGYESCEEISVSRQIVIGGRNKYLINGHNAQASQVANMFRSVQLNVNNPHFLIMQGRITKVLNMKPEEIRDMMQEVLGTLMYETEKQTAQKKLGQKDQKVKTIEDVLANQITPKVEKLREERKLYLTFSAAAQEVQRLWRFLVAYEFHAAEQIKQTARGDASKISEQVLQAKTSKKQALAEEKQTQKQMEDFTKRRSGEASRPLEEASQAEKKEAETLVRASAARDNARETRDGERAHLAELEGRLGELRQLLGGSLNEGLQVAKEQASKAQLATKEARDGVDKAMDLVESAESGVGAQGGLQEQLMQLQAQTQAGTTSGKQAMLKLGHLKQELAGVKKELDKETNDSKSSGSLHELQINVEKLQLELNSFPQNEEEGEWTSIDAELGPARDELKELKMRLNRMLDFTFADCKGLDRSKVLGRVSNLMHVKKDDDDVEKFATALEVTAGGKLFHVVTEDVQTGKTLLEGGKLTQRITIIPLDGVNSRLPDAGVLKNAEKLSSNNKKQVRLALDLVGFKEDVKAAMEHVFGTTLVCDTIETARQCAFDPKIKMRAVTLDGDLFDPSGTLTGGSKSAKSNVLLQLHALSTQEEKVANLEARKAQHVTFQQQMAHRVEIGSKLQRAQHALELFQARVAESKSFRLSKRMEEIQTEITENESLVVSSKQQVQETEIIIKALEDEARDLTSRKKKLVAEAAKAVKDAKKKLLECEEQSAKLLKRAEAVSNETENARNEANTVDLQIVSTKHLVQELEAKVNELEDKFEKQRSVYTSAKALLDKKRQALSQWDEEMSMMEKELSKHGERGREADMELKRLEGRAAKVIKDEREAETNLLKLLTAHPWIESERQFFGKAHTEYDFEDKDVEALRERHKELEKKQADMARKINKKALAMMEKAELEYDDLDKKRRIIERDRATIERVIDGLDKKKNEALISTYEKVNKDFGSIFSTLLPGARAELRPLEGQTVLDGLEVRVAFGETWKESLTELSGGQRSLLALSLVLALLRFKPAPMYILDEIDAALDLSHTQNIGQMLKSHFSQSQFIIVSLKEGMFNNANCLFRTRFVDGLSTVTRTVMKHDAVVVNDKAKVGQKRKQQLAVQDKEVVDENA